MIILMHGDCLEKMQDIPDGSVDMVLTDPPYGTTACKWDSIIQLEPMWEHLKRVIKPNGAIVLFGIEPFSSHLRLSNIKWYKHDWVWNKPRGTGFQIVKYKPMNSFENIIVFSKNGGKVLYNPQMRDRKAPRVSKNNGSTRHMEISGGRRYDGAAALMEYLIKTYTNEGETVLDFTMGSGTTGVACANLNRKFIGIELDDKYFEIAKERIEKAQQQTKLFV
jgi:site-specific DNA-methyltransferase (adenine-specific)